MSRISAISPWSCLTQYGFQWGKNRTDDVGARFSAATGTCGGAGSGAGRRQSRSRRRTALAVVVGRGVIVGEGCVQSGPGSTGELADDRSSRPSPGDKSADARLGGDRGWQSIIPMPPRRSRAAPIQAGRGATLLDGKGRSGTGLPRKPQSFSQPSPSQTAISSHFSAGLSAKKCLTRRSNSP